MTDSAPGAAPTFLTGGTGVVGKAVLSRLVAQGRPVVVLARSEASQRALEQLGAKAVRGDVLDRGSLVAGMQGCEVAYHLAGANASCLRDPAPLFTVNVGGSRNVVEAAAAAGIRRLVYTSSAATIGEQRGEVGREDTVHRGWFLSAYERSKFEAERVVMQRASTLGLDVVSVNPASVQGPGRAGGSTRLLTAFITGRLRVFVPTFLSLVDVDDCAEGHLRSEARGESGRRYLLSGASLNVEEALVMLARITGIERTPRSIPPRLALGAGFVAELAARLSGQKPPLCREVVRTLVHGHVYDGSRAGRELGLRYTPVEDTLRRTIAWLVQEGLLPPAAVRRPLENAG